MVRRHRHKNQYIDRDQSSSGWESSYVVGSTRPGRLRRSLNADQPAFRAEGFPSLRDLEWAATVGAVGQFSLAMLGHSAFSTRHSANLLLGHCHNLEWREPAQTNQALRSSDLKISVRQQWSLVPTVHFGRMPIAECRMPVLPRIIDDALGTPA